MSQLLGVLASARVPRARSNQVVVAGGLAFATCEDRLAQIAYHREVVSWCRLAPFLPALPDTAFTPEIVDAMSADADAFLARLDILEDHKEASVIVQERAVDAMTSGRAFLEARSRVHRGYEQATRTLEDLRQAYAPHARLASRSGAQHLAVLVTAETFADIRHAAARLAEHIDATHCVHVSGPWPAYSFGASKTGRLA